MQVKDRLKRLAFRVLPDGLLTGLKKFHYARALRAAAAGDEPDLPAVCRLVAEGDCVIDVGANVGFYTKFLSDRVGPAGRVYSLEPVPVTFDILTSNVRRLGLGNVEVLNYAASAADARVVMEVPEYASGGENFYEAKVVSGAGPTDRRRVTVECRSLDTLFADLARPVAFVKCDVEGHELRCLRGAARLIERSRPAWLIEVLGDPDAALSPAAEVLHLMRQAGYGTYWFDGTAVRPRRHGERRTNYFFLTPAHLERLPPAMRLPAA